MYDWHIFSVHKVETPVISVGNISVGGSGKTIMVQSLLEFFIKHHFKPAVLSRGYGRQTDDLFLVADESSLLGSVAESGDEPFLMARNFPGVPVVVSADRYTGARYLESNFDVDVIILDDGFQHRRFHRNLNILLIDKPENEITHLLPWGDQRENENGMDRADLVLYSKSGHRDNPDTNFHIISENQLLGFYGIPVIDPGPSGSFGVFAGLGNTDHFFQSIDANFGQPTVRLSFSDHATYNQLECDIIVAETCDYWITSQKDIIKLDSSFCAKNNIFFVKAKGDLPTALTTRLKHHFKL